MAKQRKLWSKHWGNTAFTVEIPENDSQQGEKTRYIQMVQTHGLVQLSLGAASINGVIDADSKFLLRLTSDADRAPREPTQTLLREVFRMMEVNGRKVWICLAKGSSEKYTGYFSSIVESINIHVMNFVAYPGAQVYWWLRQRGCLAEDINWMVRHCFTLDQQQKITKSKYISDKGYAVLDEATSDDIINAVAGEGIFDTTLGLLEKECRTATASKGHDASAIMFGEAKEGAVEAHNFSSSASITTIHSKKVDDSRSVAMQKTLAKLVFSMATSKVTSDGLDEEEMDKDEGSDYKTGSAKKLEVAIKGMQMLTRGHRKNKSSVSEQEEESAKDSTMHDHEEAAQLTKNMNAATAKLNLSSLDGDQGTEDNNEKFDNAIDREDSINPYSDNEEGKDFLEDDLSIH
jgi:hypothetical protein